MNTTAEEEQDHVVHYRFTMEDGRTEAFSVDRNRVYDAAEDQKPHAAWTRLDFHQCTNCPLKPDQFSHCPAAADLEPVAAMFSDIFSYQKIRVEVRTAERTYVHECDAQSGLRPLLGLIMSTSGCPVLRHMRVLAETHLPFATLKETTFRMTGAYLIRQYLEMKSGRTPDWNMEQLLKYFDELQTLNHCFKNRLGSAVKKDANLNALGTLFYIAMGLQMSVEENLEEFRGYFTGLEPEAK